MSTGNTLEELHRFFEDYPDDYRLEVEAEVRLKALYSCLVNATSRSMLQIGLSGLLTYVKASQRSTIINDLLLSKDYISEIITMAADHFPNAPLLSATCLYECMLNYPKKFSPFLINKFRPLLPRIIFKKTSGPNEICCKCIAHLSVLGIPSSAKQAKAWKNEYDHYLKIASLLIDHLYSGINDSLCSDVTDIEASLTSEIGDVISSTDYSTIFVNCCHILRYLFSVHLDSPITVSCDRTFKLISKVLSINSQQFNTLHRKQHFSSVFISCVQLCETLITFNSSSFMFNIRSIFTLFISLLDLVRPQAEYLTLSINIYQVLTNFFALFHRQVRMEIDSLQKLTRWILNDTTLRTRSKIPATYTSKPDHNLTQIVLHCTQQLLNIYSDHMPKDQYSLLQNHFIQTLMACQASTSMHNKPYDDERCRIGLYDILECFLINERADCPTIIAISKDLIEGAMSADPSVKVKMIVRKLKLIWQQVHDSSNHLYQPWSFLNVEKPRQITTSSMTTTNELRNVFAPPSIPIITHAQSVINTQQTSLTSSPSLPKPSVYQTPMDTTTSTFLPPPTVSYPPMDLQPKISQATVETVATPMIEENKEVYEPVPEQQRKRVKLIDTRPVQINDEEDDDGAEQIFAEESDIEEESVNEHMDEYDEEEDDDEDISELDENEEMDEDGGESEISSDEDDENFLHTNGMKKIDAHLGIHHSNVDLLDTDVPSGDAYLQAMNDNLHKKFRRPNQPFGSLHATEREFLHTNNNNLNPNYHLGQVNGDYKNNNNYPTVGNGQGNVKKDGGDIDDDDDDIVLVSDDDSEEKKPETKTNNVLSSEVITYAPDLGTTYAETVTVKTTTLIFNTDGYGKDLLEDIDRSSSSTVDHSDPSFILAIQETMESLRDAISLVSDDYPITNNEQN